MKYQINSQILRQAADAALEGTPNSREAAGRFRFVNGATVDVILAAKRVKSWASSFGKTDLLTVSLDQGFVTFTLPRPHDPTCSVDPGGSMARFAHLPVTEKLPLERFEPVILDAPEGGGEFTLTTDKIQVATRRAHRDSLDGTLAALGSARLSMKHAGGYLGEAYVKYRDALDLCTRTIMNDEIDRKRRMREASRKFKRMMREVNNELDSGRLPDLEHGCYFAADAIAEIKHAWLQYQTAKASERPKGMRVKRHESMIRSALGSVIQQIETCFQRIVEKETPGWNPHVWDEFERSREPVHKARGIVRSWPVTASQHKATILEHAATIKASQIAVKAVESAPGGEVMVAGSESIRHACKLLALFASSDETRFVLNRILFECIQSTGEQVAVTTDGKRLAILKGEYGLTHDPNTTVQLLYRTNAVREMEPMTFPSYQQVIPCEHKERIEFNVDSMIATVKRAAKLTSDKSNSIKLVFSSGLCTISANSPDTGDSSIQMPIEYAGKDSAIAFSPDYVLDGLVAMRKMKVKMASFLYVDELSPGVFDAPDAGFKYVLMPLRMS